MSTVPWWANSILTAILALAVAWVAVAFDRRKTVNQELIRKRIGIYDHVAPMLNDILCFFRCIGDFRNLPPQKIVDHKRLLDRTMNVYRPLFSPALKSSYDAFIKTCFLPYGGGTGRPALLKANFEWLATEWDADWQAGWAAGFVAPKESSTVEDVQRCYDALMAQFARELGARG